MKRVLLAKRSDLPSSFSIAKYQSTNDFGIADWVVNLEMRVFCAFMVSLVDRDSASEWDCKAFSDQILETPIYSASGFEKNPGLRKYVSSSHVRDMTVSDFYFGDRKHQGDRFEKYIQAFDRYVDAPNGEAPEDKALVEQPLWRAYEAVGIDDDRNVGLYVDLHGTEEKIVEDFRSWLRSISEERGIRTPKRTFDKRDFQGWCSSQLLPYLDLTNWAAARGTQISQQVLGTALFPEEYDVALSERIRKVVAPAARSIAHESFTDALRSQALSELAERNLHDSIPGKWDNILMADGKVVARKAES